MQVVVFDDVSHFLKVVPAVFRVFFLKVFFVLDRLHLKVFGRNGAALTIEKVKGILSRAFKPDFRELFRQIESIVKTTIHPHAP